MLFFEFRMTKASPKYDIFSIDGKRREFPVTLCSYFFDIIISGGMRALNVSKFCQFSSSNCHKNWLRRLQKKSRTEADAEFIWLSIGYKFVILLLCFRHAKVKSLPPGESHSVISLLLPLEFPFFRFIINLQTRITCAIIKNILQTHYKKVESDRSSFSNFLVSNSIFEFWRSNRFKSK